MVELPAIRQYLRLGFGPRLVHENQRERWRTVLNQIGGAELAVRHGAALAGAVCSDG